MSAYDRIKSAIQAVGDAGGDLLRLIIGDPTGAPLEWPQDQNFKETFLPGQMWQAESVVQPEIIKAIAAELDLFVWAYIDTKSAGNPAVIQHSIGVTSAVKSTIDSPQSLTITLSNAYANQYWAPMCASVGANTAIIEYTAITASTLKIALQKHDGSFYGIDDQLVTFFGVGPKP